MQNFSRLVDIARAFRLEKKTGRSFHVTFALRHGKPISIGFNNFKKSNKISHGYKPYNTWHLPSYRACVHAECDCVAKIKHLEIDRGASQSFQSALIMMIALLWRNPARIALIYLANRDIRGFSIQIIPGNL